MAVIHILDKHTAELIAAGEVVERPASAVKELIENAVDAGATQVTVAIEAGGVRLIEVSDNGTGIEAEYISAAFIRHATSKIEHEDDLNHIHTLGFRGEALASIASVARVEVLTRTEPDEFACDYRIEGGQELGMQPGARGVGTTFRVRDLFYNTPARMKFLKKDSSEGTFVADVVGRVALSHPEVSFKFIREGKLQYVTPGDGKLMSAAYAVLGREFSRGLLTADTTEGSYRVHGLVSPPRACRASRSMQHFYINGRYVKNRTMMAALESAYKGTTMQGKFPGCVLMLEMPAELVDVNVHPAKTEVRFARENDVFDVVYHGVKLALTQPGSGEQIFDFSLTKNGTAQKAAENAVSTGFVGGEASVAACPSAADADIFESPVPGREEESAAFHSGLAAVLPGQPAPGMRKAACTANGAAAADRAAAGTPVMGATRAPLNAAQPVQGAADGETKGAVPGGIAAQTVANPALTCVENADVTPCTGYTVPANAPLRASAGFASPGAFRAAGSEAMLDILPELPGDARPGGDVLPADGCANAAPARQLQEAGPACEPPSAQPGGSDPSFAPEQTSFVPDESGRLQFVGEAFKTYIIAQRGDELCLIDKHAAHERMLYEELAASYGDVESQLLLAPVTVNLSAEEKQALLDNADLLESVGLEADDFGGSTVLIRAVPCDVEASDVEDLTVELARKLARGSRDALNERTEWVLHSIACRAAIKAGDRTPPQQLLHLAEQILSGRVPPFCPHGRPCVLKLTRKELEKQFGRLV